MNANEKGVFTPAFQSEARSRASGASRTRAYLRCKARYRYGKERSERLRRFIFPFRICKRNNKECSVYLYVLRIRALTRPMNANR